VSDESEKQVILRLVQAKQITPEEGARLLAAVGEAGARSAAPAIFAPAVTPTSVDSRLLKIHAQEPSGHRVDLSIPIKGMPAVLRFAARWVPEEYQGSVQSAADALTTGYRGDLLNVAEPSGETIRIWIE
jgi:hypothetical protein